MAHNGTMLLLPFSDRQRRKLLQQQSSVMVKVGHAVLSAVELNTLSAKPSCPHILYYSDHARVTFRHKS